MSAAGKTTGYLLAGHGVVLGVSLAVNALSAHALGPDGRGALALALQCAYLLHLVVVAGVDRAYPLALPAPAAVGPAARECGRLVVPGAVAVAVLGAAVGALLAARGGGAAAGAPLPVLVAAVAVASVGLTAVRTAAVTVGDGATYLRAHLLGQATVLCGAVVLAAAGQGAPTAWLALYAAAPLVVVGAGYLRGRGGPAPDAGPARAGRIRSAGRRLLPGALAAFGTLRADRLLLPLLASVPALGLYAVAAAFAELCVVPVQNYVDAHLPRWRDGAVPPLGRLFGAAAAYALAAAAAVAVAGAAFIRVALPAAFAESARVLPVLAAAAGAWAFSRVAAGVVTAARPPGAVSGADAAVLVLTVSAHLALIPRYGLWGAAGAALGGYLAAAVLMAWLAVTAARPPRPDRQAVTARAAR
ncbi:hypothetical protein GCM10010124_23380 [Pilimelia terevasa]|uniref:Polysaccharide biosynthesis protein n=1 Tax=Pilimelia terevasa TaxID=53372 RepID=A0A8J3BLD5_9ACTN|nr:hypothetical protein [Pilimelia terevasa]GGK29961.1 hypothetical protein GCM10010124_23380 [Pilimelia terevasa]